MKNTQTFEEFVSESHDEVNEAMVQVAGKGKPAGAQILATVILKHLEDKKALASNANMKSLTDEIKNLIMDSTF
jgi:hypothetical protein